MPKQDDGGPAFPSVGEKGLTVRDYFAVHASETDVHQAIVRYKLRYDGDCNFVEARYLHADEMLKQREVGPGHTGDTKVTKGSFEERFEEKIKDYINYHIDGSHERLTKEQVRKMLEEEKS